MTTFRVSRTMHLDININDIPDLYDEENPEEAALEWAYEHPAWQWDDTEGWSIREL